VPDKEGKKVFTSVCGKIKPTGNWSIYWSHALKCPECINNIPEEVMKKAIEKYGEERVKSVISEKKSLLSGTKKDTTSPAIDIDSHPTIEGLKKSVAGLGRDVGKLSEAVNAVVSQVKTIPSMQESINNLAKSVEAIPRLQDNVKKLAEALRLVVDNVKATPNPNFNTKPQVAQEPAEQGEKQDIPQRPAEADQQPADTAMSEQTPSMGAELTPDQINRVQAYLDEQKRKLGMQTGSQGYPSSAPYSQPQPPQMGVFDRVRDIVNEVRNLVSAWKGEAGPPRLTPDEIAAEIVLKNLRTDPLEMFIKGQEMSDKRYENLIKLIVSGKVPVAKEEKPVRETSPKTEAKEEVTKEHLEE